MDEQRCPECGLRFLDAEGLERHRTEAHDPATPRLPEEAERADTGTRVALGIVILGAVAVVVVVALGFAGVFEKDTVAEQPGTPAYRLVRELQTEGTIDDFRAVEPDEGWDQEYELDGSDGVLRMRGRSVSFETYLDDDLYDALERKLRAEGYQING